MKGVCKDCPDRHPACHDKCEKYQTAKNEKIEAKRKWQDEHYGSYQLTMMYSERKAKKMRKYKGDLW